MTGILIVMNRINSYLRGLKASDKLLVSTQLLLVAYLIGQGSVLFVQLMSTVFNSNELTGYLVLIIAIFSFSFQFSDLGNSTYVTKKVLSQSGNKDSLIPFVLARALFAVVFNVILFFYVFLLQDTHVFILIYSFFVTVAGFFYGFSKITGIEFKGNYFPVALYNISHWLLVSLGLCFFIFFDASYYNYIAVFHGITMCILAWKTSSFKINAISTMPEFKTAFQFIFPQVSGQIWGRLVLFIIASAKGISEVGVLGLTKYIQVFFTLMFGFYTRPILRSYIVSSVDRYSVVDVICLYKKFWIFSLFIPLFYFAADAFSSYAGKQNEWLMIILIVPFSILSQAVVQISFLNLPESKNIIISFCGLLSNIVVFFLLFDQSVVLSLVFGEISQCVINILLYALMIKFKNGKY